MIDFVVHWSDAKVTTVSLRETIAMTDFIGLFDAGAISHMEIISYNPGRCY